MNKEKELNKKQGIYMPIFFILVAITIIALFRFKYMNESSKTTPPVVAMNETARITNPNQPFPKISCKGHIRNGETNQTECFFPWDTTKQFQFKNHLACQDITNQYIDRNQTSQDAIGLEVLFQKEDYSKFTLDSQEKIMTRSRDAGSMNTAEPYTIIQDSHDVIQAVRPLKDMNKTASYDFITLSRATGKGMEVSHNLAFDMHQDSITSSFFQCK